MTVFDSHTGELLVGENEKYLVPGEYYSIIEDIYMTGIYPSFEKDDGCYIVKYKLVSAETLEESMFIETYYPNQSTPRSDLFFDYLYEHFPCVGEDDAYIGTREKLWISLDIVGGHAYPVVSKREFVDYSKSYKENYLNEENDEEEDD